MSHLNLLVLLFLPALCHSGAPPYLDDNCIVPGYNIPGGAFNIKYFVGSATECRRKCLANSNCRAADWDSSSSKCFLKEIYGTTGVLNPKGSDSSIARTCGKQFKRRSQLNCIPASRCS